MKHVRESSVKQAPNRNRSSVRQERRSEGEDKPFSCTEPIQLRTKIHEALLYAPVHIYGMVIRHRGNFK
jgi:hypothetical protein